MGVVQLTMSFVLSLVPLVVKLFEISPQRTQRILYNYCKKPCRLIVQRFHGVLVP